jgi:hypothetical protein
MTAEEARQKKQRSTTKVCPPSRFEKPISQNQALQRQNRAKKANTGSQLRKSG